MALNFKKTVSGAVPRVPYDERRIVRGLAETGCQYAAYAQARDAVESKDPRLASEYLRLLVLGTGEDVRVFCERNRVQMNKQSCSTPVRKKAFTDAEEAAQRIESFVVGGSLKLSAFTTMPRMPVRLVVAGCEFETPDSFTMPDGRLAVVVFASQLDDGPPGSPFRWWHRLHLEAQMAAMAAGLRDGASFMLVGVSSKDAPVVRAVEVPLAAGGVLSALSSFVGAVTSGKVDACLNSSCPQCAADSMDVVLEQP